MNEGLSAAFIKSGVNEVSNSWTSNKRGRKLGSINNIDTVNNKTRIYV